MNRVKDIMSKAQIDSDISHEEFALLSYDEQDVTKCYRAMLLCCLKWKNNTVKKTQQNPTE